ncbi:unnamed protein product [Ceutorhynchus assimilis]|uniref:Cytochrome P450 n=1 Tax=Ceutorhynchus assimilis TaxID=467358 RepID=A0A9N9QFT7_9CUCU|nr:unnamed protein product [Ceutorhynchus assimilis]
MYFWLTPILVFALLGLLVRLYIIYTHLNGFPVPPFVPILGHLHYYLDPHNSLSYLTSNLIKHGGVIRQFIGPRKPSLAIGNKEFLQFMCTNNKYVCKAKYYDFMKSWLGEGLITSDGPKWLARRKALTASFTQTSVLKSFVQTFEEKGDILVTILGKLQNRNINIHPIMKRFTLDIIYETAMGLKLDSQSTTKDSAYAKAIETICTSIQERMFSYLKQFQFFYQFTETCEKERRGLAIVDWALHKIIEKKRESKEKTDQHKSMLDLLLEIDIDGKVLSIDDIREEINTFLFAGYDTSSSAMSLALYQIAQNPEIQEKLYQEQLDIFKDELKPQVTYDKLQEMVYLEMVIKETLRMHTIVPCIGKKITKDLIYDGKLLPENLNFNVCIHAFHHNPAYFPEPEKFLPERFANKTNIKKFTYMPFGVKPRQCLGKNFAMLEMKSALSKLVRNFTFTQVPGHQLKLVPKLVLFSTSGIGVRLKKRHILKM